MPLRKPDLFTSVEDDNKKKKKSMFDFGAGNKVSDSFFRPKKDSAYNKMRMGGGGNFIGPSKDILKRRGL